MATLEEIMSPAANATPQAQPMPVPDGMAPAPKVVTLDDIMGPKTPTPAAMPVVTPSAEQIAESHKPGIVSDLIQGGIRGESTLQGAKVGAAALSEFGPPGVVLGMVGGGMIGNFVGKQISDPVDEAITGKSPSEDSVGDVAVSTGENLVGAGLVKGIFKLAKPAFEFVSEKIAQKTGDFLQGAMKPLDPIAKSIKGIGDTLQDSATMQRARLVGAETRTAFQKRAVQNLAEATDAIIPDKELAQREIESAVKTIESDNFFNGLTVSGGQLERRLLVRKAYLGRELQNEIRSADDYAQNVLKTNIHLDTDAFSNSVKSWAKEEFFKSDMPTVNNIIKNEFVDELGQGPVTFSKLNDIKQKLYNKINWNPTASNPNGAVNMENVTRQRIAGMIKDSINDLYTDLVGSTAQVQGAEVIGNVAGVNRLQQLNDLYHGYATVDRVLNAKVGQEKAMSIFKRSLRTFAGAGTSFMAAYALTNNPSIASKAALAVGAADSTLARGMIASGISDTGKAFSAFGEDISNGLPQTAKKISNSIIGFGQLLTRLKVEGAIINQGEAPSPGLTEVPLDPDVKAKIMSAESEGPDEQMAALGEAKIAARDTGIFEPSPIPGIHSFIAAHPDDKERMGYITDPMEKNKFAQLVQRFEESPIQRAKIISALSTDGSVVDIPKRIKEMANPIQESIPMVDKTKILPAPTTSPSPSPSKSDTVEVTNGAEQFSRVLHPY